MAFSCANFIHYFPTPNNNNPDLHTRCHLPPPPHRRGSARVKCSAPQPETGEGKENNNNNNDPLPTLQKLFKGVKDKDTSLLAEAAAAAFPQVGNFIPFLPFFRARLLMWDYTSRLLNTLRNSLVFSVQPTTEGGSTVGVKWRLGWEKIVVTLGKGINITSHNTLGGKLFIGNLETIMDPLLQLMPKLMNSNLVAEEKLKKIAISLSLGFFLLLLSLFFFQFSVR